MLSPDMLQALVSYACDLRCFSRQVQDALVTTFKKRSMYRAMQAEPHVYRDKESVDIHLDSEAVSRNHAAIVHHTTGKVYIIDLHSVRSVS